MFRDVKGHSWAALLAGALFILPWAFWLRALVPERPRELEEWEAHASPVLTPEQRMSRATYWRTCERSTECEPPLGCLTHSSFKEPLCSDSQCETDAQCHEGTTCQAVRTEGDGPWVRLCRTAGLRKEGEECGGLLALSRERACERGTVCANSFCGRPCRLTEPTSCPEGFVCTQSSHAPSACLPSCEHKGCAEGQTCVRHFSGASTCAGVLGDNCQAQPCASGQRCVVFTKPERPGEARMQCLQGCGADHPPCSEGYVCLAGSCRQSCDSQRPGTCGPSAHCLQKDPTHLGFCQLGG